MDNKLYEIATHFAFEGKVKNIRPLGEGLINETFLVETDDAEKSYILQCKNKNIFKDIPAMMDNIEKVTQHLKKKITAYGGDSLRETLTVIRSTDGKLYYQDAEGEYWASCLFIKDTVAYQYADSPELAYRGGQGIGMFQNLLSDMIEPLADILPGFHNIKFRFQQWDEALKNDLAHRKNELTEEISWIESYRTEMLNFWRKIETGIIPTRITHNDTKISNILFNQEGKALCVIDLDTVLSSTCLNDYGDAIRAYANAGLEDDRDVNNVYLKMDIFESYTRGYLSETMQFLTKEEKDNLVFSIKYITFEQVLRFLMDYINGDTYYRISYPTHNLVRTHAQYKLLQSIEENYDAMSDFITSV